MNPIQLLRELAKIFFQNHIHFKPAKIVLFADEKRINPDYWLIIS